MDMQDHDEAVAAAPPERESASHPLLDELKGKLAAYVDLSVSKRIYYNLKHRFWSLDEQSFDLSYAGLLRRLQGSSQPIKDGQEHVVVLCETVEAIYRNGLKSKIHGGAWG